MRVWIGTIGQLSNGSIEYVTLRVRVWIETPEVVEKEFVNAVTLRVRVWIETIWLVIILCLVWSPSA